MIPMEQDQGFLVNHNEKGIEKFTVSIDKVLRSYLYLYWHPLKRRELFLFCFFVRFLQMNHELKVASKRGIVQKMHQ